MWDTFVGTLVSSWDKLIGTLSFLWGKVVSDPSWAQTAIAALNAILTFGMLVAVAITARLAVKDRKERLAHTVEAELSPSERHADWWVLRITLRNFGPTTLIASELEIMCPAEALVLPRSGSMVDKGEAKRLIATRMTALPAGSTREVIRTDLLHTGGVSTRDVPGDTASSEFLLYASSSSRRRKVTMRLHSFRRTRADRRISLPIKIIIPASTKRQAP